MKIRDYIILSTCTIINCSIAAILMLSSKTNLKDSTAIFSNLGSGIGGFSGLIIGIITIYLVYMTYNSQREANKNADSINNLNTLKINIQSAREFLDNFQYKSNNKIYIGNDAVKAFELSLYDCSDGMNGMPNFRIEKRKIVRDTSDYDKTIIYNILEFLRKLLYLLDMLRANNLTDSDKKAALWFLQDLWSYYLSNFDEVAELVKVSILSSPREKENYNIFGINNFNFFVYQMIEYKKAVDRIEDYNFLTFRRGETISTDGEIEDFLNPQLDIDGLKEI